MRIFDYEAIKAIAKQANMRVTDLLALAPQNDPFYVGTPGDLEMARWFGSIWRRAGYSSGVHLRRVHYWIVSQSPAVQMPNGLPYENTEKCWQFLLQASKKARYLGVIQIADVADNKNPTPHVHANYFGLEPGYQINLPELKTPHIWIDGMDVIDAQPYHLELWCEKSTMNDVLLPICQRYGANLVTFEGEVSITACYQLIGRVQKADKPARVWYISDFDPAGNSMPVAMSRKVEFMLNHYGCLFDVRINPLALTSEQVDQYNLPRIPIKETEKRAAKFEVAFGFGAVELDALEAIYPGILAQMVDEAFSEYYSEDAADEVARQRERLEEAIQTHIDAITARYTAEIAAIQKMVDELKAIDVDASEYEVEQYDADVTENGGWLFDSRRDYVKQIVHYKAHKGMPVGE